MCQLHGIATEAAYTADFVPLDLSIIVPFALLQQTHFSLLTPIDDDHGFGMACV